MKRERQAREHSPAAEKPAQAPRLKKDPGDPVAVRAGGLPELSLCWGQRPG